MQHPTDKSFAVKLSRESLGPQSTVLSKNSPACIFISKWKMAQIYYILSKSLNKLTQIQTINQLVCCYFICRYKNCMCMKKDTKKISFHAEWKNILFVLIRTWSKQHNDFIRMFVRDAMETALFIPFVQLQRASVIPELAADLFVLFRKFPVNLPGQKSHGFDQTLQNWNGKTV